VGRRAEQSILQILAKSVVDGKGDNQRSHSRGDSGDRNTCDDAYKRLATFCAEIAGSDEKLKAHETKKLLAVST
jgi:hypothetical protein